MRFALAILLAACTPQQQPVTSAPVSTPDAAAIGGAWYRSLVKTHGVKGVQVGPVPYVPEGFWIATRDESEPTHEDWGRFYQGLKPTLAAFKAAHIGGDDGLSGPYTVGDYFTIRSEILVFKPAIFIGKEALLADLVERLQTYLRRPENQLYRIGYFDPTGSLVVYPQAIFLGERRFESADALQPELAAWLLKL